MQGKTAAPTCVRQKAQQWTLDPARPGKMTRQAAVKGTRCTPYLHARGRWQERCKRDTT
eukprot:CAMPEP_0171255512 /NCGR_PEP_ID=MMETSP0790-20130122/52807_1 /TAXON_ID=2925 /ORGANISM="Alexandrium catenella, Strain OF101" /LENGTH=58 /DNA_ID=CAMNT_0011723471 /DNA_START=76 /DNA_END=248 /DNA_ORIENTATION=+